MALNFSHRPLFPPHISEEKLISPMRIGNGYPFEEKKVEDSLDYGRDGKSGAQESSLHKDILDLLPSDPFGMDISTTFTAITGWLEDLEMDYGGYSRGPVGAGDGNYSLFEGLNFIWSNAMRFQAFPAQGDFEPKADVVGDADVCLMVEDDGNASGHDSLGPVCNMEAILSMGHDFIGDSNSAVQAQRSRDCEESQIPCSDGDEGTPHSAFYFSLRCMSARDLLVVETVCRSLHSAVRSDTLLWRSIHIDQPLNEKITDDILLELTKRAQGNLLCLSLVECPRITNDALKHVLENNPRLTKLSVPGCTKLSIDGILSILKSLKTMGAQSVKQLRIGGIYGVTQKHFEELKFLLGIDSQMQQNVHEPHFYHRGNFYVSCDNDRSIDIEMCPRCENLRLIYDCPAENCQGKEHPTKSCRACTLCIARCVQCGCCINDSEYVETFCLEFLCSDCWKQVVNCQEKQEGKITAPKSSVLQESNCSLHFHS